MRTPDFILFVKGDGSGQYNPVTGKYDTGIRAEWGLPCMVIPMTMKREFDQYGTRNRRMVTVELNTRMDEDFDYALLTSETSNLKSVKFKKVEQNTPNKNTTIRLERMG